MRYFKDLPIWYSKNSSDRVDGRIYNQFKPFRPGYICAEFGVEACLVIRYKKEKLKRKAKRCYLRKDLANLCTDGILKVL